MVFDICSYTLRSFRIDSKYNIATDTRTNIITIEKNTDKLIKHTDALVLRVRLKLELVFTYSLSALAAFFAVFFVAAFFVAVFFAVFFAGFSSATSASDTAASAGSASAFATLAFFGAAL